MTFKDYFDSLEDPKKQFIEQIARATETESVSTIYRWLSGAIEPPMIKKRIIADMLEKSIEELFPTTEEVEQ